MKDCECENIAAADRAFLEYLEKSFAAYPDRGVAGRFVALDGVSIEDRPAECDVIGRIAVAAERAVAAREDELELAVARLAEDGDAVRLAPSACIVLLLLVEAVVPVPGQPRPVGRGLSVTARNRPRKDAGRAERRDRAHWPWR